MVYALKAAGAKAIGFDIVFTEPDDPPEDRALARAIAESKNLFLSFYFNDIKDLPSGSQPILPVLEMRKAAAGICPINGPSDRDGIIRSIPLLVIRANDRLYPTLGLGLTLSYLNIPPERLKLNRGHLEITGSQGQKLLIPMDRRGRMIVNLYVFSN